MESKTMMKRGIVIIEIEKWRIEILKNKIEL